MQLAPEQLANFRAWFAEYDSQRWDQQLAADAAAGRLDTLANEALRDYQAGRITPKLPTGTLGNEMINNPLKFCCKRLLSSFFG